MSTPPLSQPRPEDETDARSSSHEVVRAELTGSGADGPLEHADHERDVAGSEPSAGAGASPAAGNETVEKATDEPATDEPERPEAEADEAAPDDAPADGAPADDASGDAPADDAPADEVPADEAAAGRVDDGESPSAVAAADDELRGPASDEEPDDGDDLPAEDDGGVAATEDPGRPRAREFVRAGARFRAGILIGVLIGLLGFALAVQVRSNTSTSGLPSARQEDLVRILDDLSSREDRLRRQIASLEAAKARLSTTGDRSQVALSEARTRSTALGILAGTVPARGPGIQLIINDPNGKITAEDLLDAVEELRAAGAEAIQVGGVRIGLDSSFTSADGGLRVDGQRVDAPYTILAIGEPGTLATAMGIPGGVVDAARQAGGEARIVRQQQLVIRALRTLRPPQYSRPADGGR